MAKMKFKGLEEYERILHKIYAFTPEMIKQTVKAGGDVMADAMRSSIEGIPVDNRRVKEGETLSGISTLQKAGLLESFGVAPVRNDDGYVNVKLGFDGYNGLHTAKYPKGQPNAMIARAVNSGTSFRQKYPFVDRTVREYKKKTEDAMIKKFDEAMKAIVD